MKRITSIVPNSQYPDNLAVTFFDVSFPTHMRRYNILIPFVSESVDSPVETTEGHV